MTELPSSSLLLLCSVNLLVDDPQDVSSRIAFVFDQPTYLVLPNVTALPPRPVQSHHPLNVASIPATVPNP